MSTALRQIQTLQYLGRPVCLSEVYLLTETGEFGFLTELSAKDTIRDIAKIAISSGLTVGTSGMNGEAVSEALFAAQSAADVMSSVKEITDDSSELGTLLSSVKGLSIRQGTDKIYSIVENALNKILKYAKSAGSSVADFVGKIKEQIKSVIINLNRSISDWISALIPDDFGVGGPIIREMLNTLASYESEHPYDIVAGLANKVPVILDPPRLQQLLTDMLDQLVAFIGEMENPKTLSKKLLSKAGKIAQKSAEMTAMTTVAPAYAAYKGIALALKKMTGTDITTAKGIKEFLNTKVRENIPVAVKTFEKIMTIFFSVVSALQVIIKFDVDATKDNESDKKTGNKEKTDEPKQDKEEVLNDSQISLSELRTFIRYSLEKM